MGLIHIFKDERDKPNIEILGEDRGRNVQYGRRIDNPKIKIVKIGLVVPEVPKGFISIKPEDGKEIELEMNSWTRNYYNRLATQILGVNSNIFGSTGGAGYLNIRDTAGAYENVASPSAICYLTTLRIEALNGVQGLQGTVGVKTGSNVGSGSGVFSFDDYTLTDYTHGLADGNLFWNPEVATQVSYNAGTRVWTASNTRFLDNYGTTNITNINETGLYCKSYSKNVIYLEERNVLLSPITVLPKQALRIKHQRDYTFPSVAGDWIRNGYNFWLSNALICVITDATTYADGYRSLKLESGSFASDGDTAVSVDVSATRGYMDAINDSDFGMLVGEGNTAVGLDDFQLATKRVHSAAFTYSVVTRVSYTYTAGTKTYKVTYSRTVTDVSAGNLTIAEIALGIRAGLNDSGAGFDGIISRTVLGSPQALVNGESLEVIYTVSMTFPS